MSSEKDPFDSSMPISGIESFDVERALKTDPMSELKHAVMAAQDYIDMLLQSGTELAQVKEIVEKIIDTLENLAIESELLGERATIVGHDIYFPYEAMDEEGNTILGAKKVATEDDTRFFDEVHAYGAFGGIHCIVQLDSNVQSDGGVAMEVPRKISLCFQVGIAIDNVPHTSGTRYAYGDVRAVRLEFDKELAQRSAGRLYSALPPYHFYNRQKTEELAYLESSIHDIVGFDADNIKKLRSIGHELEKMAGFNGMDLPLAAQDALADMIKIKLHSFGVSYVCETSKVIFKGGIEEAILPGRQTPLQRQNDTFKISSDLFDVVWVKNGSTVMPSLVFEGNISVSSTKYNKSIKRVICIPLREIYSLFPVR